MKKPQNKNNTLSIIYSDNSGIYEWRSDGGGYYKHYLVEYYKDLKNYLE
jgi:hypothetical protein